MMLFIFLFGCFSLVNCHSALSMESLLLDCDLLDMPLAKQDLTGFWCPGDYGSFLGELLVVVVHFPLIEGI